MRAGVAYALSVGMLSLLFLAGLLLMTFPRSKILMLLGLFIIEITLYIAAVIIGILIEKYQFSFL